MVYFPVLGAGEGAVRMLGVFVCGFFCVCVFLVASPGTNILFAAVRKSQSLGNRFGARVGGSERREFSLQNFSSGALGDGGP